MRKKRKSQSDDRPFTAEEANSPVLKHAGKRNMDDLEAMQACLALAQDIYDRAVSRNDAALAAEAQADIAFYKARLAKIRA